MVLDLAGRIVRHLEDGVRQAGAHVVTWDGRSDAGKPVSAGLYIVRFAAGDIRQSRRVLLIR
jgi:flagellar hook assembly protein FlgD